MENKHFTKAMEIVNGAIFRHHLQSFVQSGSLSGDEKSNLNDSMKPMCQEAISLLRNAHKQEPENPEINAELVKAFHLDLVRIMEIGKPSEKVRIIQTHFIGEDGSPVHGYPAMMEYHAERCKRNDPTGKYSKMLSDLLSPLSK